MILLEDEQKFTDSLGALTLVTFDGDGKRKTWKKVFNHLHGEIELNGKPTRVKAIKSALAEGTGAAGTILDAGLTVATGHGAIALTHVQREGKSVMDAETFVRGTGSLEGKVLS